MSTFYEELFVRGDLSAEDLFTQVFTGVNLDYTCGLFYIRCGQGEPLHYLPEWVDESSHSFGFEYTTDVAKPVVHQLMLALIAYSNFRLHHGHTAKVFRGSYAHVAGERTVLHAVEGSNVMTVTPAIAKRDIAGTFGRNFEGMQVVVQDVVVPLRSGIYESPD